MGLHFPFLFVLWCLRGLQWRHSVLWQNEARRNGTLLLIMCWRCGVLWWKEGGNERLNETPKRVRDDNRSLAIQLVAVWCRIGGVFLPINSFHGKNVVVSHFCNTFTAVNTYVIVKFANIKKILYFLHGPWCSLQTINLCCVLTGGTFYYKHFCVETY